jgi:nucleoside 2-deoxyribosyltransferase
VTFTVYLAGGMTNPWRERVIDALPQFTFLCPTTSIKDAAEYTARDLLLVRSADIVLAYMEADNPSGLGLALECGYALGLGKIVIVVNESASRYMAIVEQSASLAFHDFSVALEALAKW